MHYKNLTCSITSTMMGTIKKITELIRYNKKKHMYISLLIKLVCMYALWYVLSCGGYTIWQLWCKLSPWCVPLVWIFWSLYLNYFAFDQCTPKGGSDEVSNIIGCLRLRVTLNFPIFYRMCLVIVVKMTRHIMSTWTSYGNQTSNHC